MTAKSLIFIPAALVATGIVLSLSGCAEAAINDSGQSQVNGPVGTENLPYPTVAPDFDATDGINRGDFTNWYTNSGWVALNDGRKVYCVDLDNTVSCDWDHTTSDK